MPCRIQQIVLARHWLRCVGHAQRRQPVPRVVAAAVHHAVRIRRALQTPHVVVPVRRRYRVVFRHRRQPVQRVVRVIGRRPARVRHLRALRPCISVRHRHRMGGRTKEGSSEILEWGAQ